MHGLAFLAAGAALLTGALSHPHHELSTSEITRRSGLSRRCESSVAAMNRRRWTKRNDKRAASGNVTWSITTEAPYYDTIQNDTCILTETTTEGPYVWPQSQTLRQDITEDQPGIPMLLDIGVMDVETCEPLPDVLVDIWHCNATGSYSSFTGRDPNTPYEELLDQLNMTIFDDLHTDSSTFLRGLWPTDVQGVTEFTTIVPGFYIERTIHIHVQVHEDYVIRGNGTVASSNTVSTGQLFMDEALSEQLMALEPYASHTEIDRTTNDVDSIYAQQSANGYDPILSIVPMDGENVENGVIGYITIGVDSASKRKLKAK
ncbi:protocatechuate 3,4-dioxygenase beta subunit [Xylariomycetidae sp. FL2044]|nr:protocatechuate 3,4-dioxygenase beta subunit [Xylariomycetidae sp. FL2044]